jgi:hypothetical protein
MKEYTQHNLIISYINQHGSITPLEAFNDLGITKLATRISEMRREGIEIEGETISVMNRFGQKCHVKRYTLKEKANEENQQV